MSSNNVFLSQTGMFFMKILKYLRPLLFLMVFCYLGCGESDDSYTTHAWILDIEIKIYSQDTSTDIQLPWEFTTDWSVEEQLPTPPKNAKAVIVLIDSSYGGCDGVPYLSDLHTPNPETGPGYIAWKTGDMIEIEVWQSIYTGDDDCATSVDNWRMSVFVGYCVPGEYTLKVSDIETQFTVD